MLAESDTVAVVGTVSEKVLERLLLSDTEMVEEVDSDAVVEELIEPDVDTLLEGEIVSDVVSVLAERDIVAVSGTLPVIEMVRLSVSAMDDVVVRERDAVEAIESVVVRDPESDADSDADTVTVFAESDGVAVSGTLLVIEMVRLSVSAMDDVVEIVKEAVLGNESVVVRDVETEKDRVEDSVAVGTEILRDAVSGIDWVVEALVLSVIGSDNVVEKVPKVSDTEVEMDPETEREELFESEEEADMETLSDNVIVSDSLMDIERLIVLLRWQRGPAHPSLQLHTHRG